jgi:penicillin-binding protein 2
MVFGRWRKARRLSVEIHPDEILIDASNLPEFDQDQMEGRIERPLNRSTFVAAGAVLALVCVGLVVRAGTLQIVRGGAYAQQALNNQLTQTPIFADRGIIEDRTGRPLAYNERASLDDAFATRAYAAIPGVAHAVGYVKPPAKDSSGFYYRDYFAGMDGAELAYNDELAGRNGRELTETDARGAVVSQAQVDPPAAGQKVVLSIDADVTSGLYQALEKVAEGAHFQGAAGVMMDVRTGELIALTSYPEYSSQMMTDGNAAAIKAYNADPYQPFLDRAADGLYAPGSIVKPVMATAGLTEGVITPQTTIYSSGSISVPNPYDPAHPSIFKDWRVNGLMTVRDALAVSSDVFFYEVGGGYEGQKGIGIGNIDKYFSMFGFGQDPGLAGFVSAAGNIPTPAWKAKTFPDDPTWRIGDTYHTAIGQYGMLVSPLQAVREAAAIGNGGTLLVPSLIASTSPQGTKLPLSPDVLEVVREGMRQGVTKGIAQGINFGFVSPAAKTGTAQVGMHNEHQNAWMIGFWPYDNPKYAFAVVLEKAPAGTAVGGAAVMAAFLQYLDEHDPQYLQ